MSKYAINFSESAANTLEDNILFLKKFNVNHALKMMEIIIESINKLIIFPHSHSIYKITSRCIYRKLTIKKRYHIIYTVTSSSIIVFYILDGRQAYDTYFKSLL